MKQEEQPDALYYTRESSLIAASFIFICHLIVKNKAPNQALSFFVTRLVNM